MAKTVITAKHAGFCFGVQRAVEEAGRCADKYGGLSTYGPLIHNDSAVRDLEQMGVRAISPEFSALPEHSEGAILIRAHGVGRKTEAELKRRFATVVDATCPFVKKIHRIVEEHSKAGEQIIIIGSANHPEVIGIRGWVQEGSDCFIVSNKKEAEELRPNPRKKACIVVQTTFQLNKFQELVEIIRQKVYDVVANNTICNATEERQAEAARIAEAVDAMLVLGGENSSNSQKLFEICRQRCKHTYFLQTADDLNLDELLFFDSVGITAGASTPHYIIEEVQKRCQK